MAILRYAETALDMTALGFHAAFAVTTAKWLEASDITTPPLGSKGALAESHVMTIDSRVVLTGPGQVLAWGVNLGLEGTALSGGRISLLQMANLDLRHVALRAVDLQAAALTTDQTDDRALVERLLRGDDLIDLGGADDLVFAGAGKDLINDQGGADLIHGGAGGDMIFASGEGDTVLGGAGNDFILHDFGKAFLLGGAGDDTLVGGSGREVVSGGAGRDCFVLHHGGHDVLRDFTPGEDKLALPSAYFGTEAPPREVLTDQGLKLVGEGYSILLLGVSELTARDITDRGPLMDDRAERVFFDGWDYA